MWFITFGNDVLICVLTIVRKWSWQLGFPIPSFQVPISLLNFLGLPVLCASWWPLDVQSPPNLQPAWCTFEIKQQHVHTGPYWTSRCLQSNRRVRHPSLQFPERTSTNLTTGTFARPKYPVNNPWTLFDELTTVQETMNSAGVISPSPLSKNLASTLCLPTLV